MVASSAGVAEMGPVSISTASGYYGLLSIVVVGVVVAAIDEPSTSGSSMNSSGMGGGCAY